MSRADKLCSVADCPEIQPCPVPGHQRQPWEGSNRRRELPPDWDVRRARILERDPICTSCGNALSVEVHHTGDKHDHRDEVLAGVCVACHKAETQRQAAEARRQRAPA